MVGKVHLAAAHIALQFSSKKRKEVADCGYISINNPLMQTLSLTHGLCQESILLANLKGAHYFPKLDLRDGYYQIM